MAINPIQITQPQAYSGGADFSQLANLGNIYRETQKREGLAELGKQLAEGKITYQQAAGRAAEFGELPASLKFSELSEARRLQDLQLAASAKFGQDLQGFLGGGGRAPAAEGPAPTQTAAVPPRQPTEEIPGVVRTNPDGSIAGNISAPTLPAAPGAVPAAPPAPAPAVAEGPSTPPAAPAKTAAMLPPEQRLPMLMRAYSSPFLPAAQKELAGKLLTETLAELKPHERVNYLQAMKDSDPALANKSLFEIEKDLKQTGATSVVMTGEKEQSKGVGKDLADIQTGAIRAGLKVPKMLGTLDIMERAANDPNFFSGTQLGSKAVLAWKRALAAVGGPEFDEKAASTEVFDKASKQLVTEVLSGDKGGAGLGSGVSNADREFIEGTAPNLANSKEGNLALIQMHRMLAQREAVVAKMTREYAAKNKGLIDYEFLQKVADFQEANPVFKDFKLPDAAMKAQAASSGTHKDIPFKVNQ